MSHYLDPLAFECEKYIIHGDELQNLSGKVPDEIQKFIDLVRELYVSHEGWEAYMREYGGSTAVTKHPDHGWVMLGAGQGPFIMWMENPDEDYKKAEEARKQREKALKANEYD